MEEAKPPNTKKKRNTSTVRKHRKETVDFCLFFIKGSIKNRTADGHDDVMTYTGNARRVSSMMQNHHENQRFSTINLDVLLRSEFLNINISELYQRSAVVVLETDVSFG